MHYTMLQDILKLSTNTYADVRKKAQSGMCGWGHYLSARFLYALLSSTRIKLCVECLYTARSDVWGAAVLPRGQV